MKQHGRSFRTRFLSEHTAISLNVSKKIPNLRSLTVGLRVSIFDQDARLFQSNLLDNGILEMISFPAFESLILESTFSQMPETNFNAFKAKWIQKSIGEGYLWAAQHFTETTGDEMDKSSPSCPPVPLSSYSLDNLGRLPGGVTLTLIDLCTPKKLPNFSSINFQQSSRISDDMVKSIANSKIKTFTTVYSFYGCRVANAFTQKLLKYLPATIEVLKLHSCPAVEVPCKFPSTLKHVELGLVYYLKPHLKACFSEGLESLALYFDETFECDEQHEYEFDYFDVTGLPNSLKTLEFREIPYIRKKKMRITGNFPADLETLFLSDGHFVFDPKFLLPRLTTKTTVLRQAESWSMDGIESIPYSRYQIRKV